MTCLADDLAHAMWVRQVAPLNVCRRIAPKVLAALEDIERQAVGGNARKENT